MAAVAPTLRDRIQPKFGIVMISWLLVKTESVNPAFSAPKIKHVLLKGTYSKAFLEGKLMLFSTATGM